MSVLKYFPCEAEWGKWWQSLEEVHIEVRVPKGTKSRDVKVEASNSQITFKGAELLWSLEDGGSLLDIVLVKLNYVGGEEPWPSLMDDSRYKVEQNAYEEMKKSAELEKLKQQTNAIQVFLIK
ncbi:nudC domain-containing protein 2-like [Daktulosphaira vitifoliae]|uniref:nudC domain-containing protein 2-like n=1 Tax=Daktulosphaira vitifoliae TaxID=58002 RepID=UPI0021AA5455|nr:nudC domain-containing protein 2-like [Daktulosphaira vitifoliae]